MTNPAPDELNIEDNKRVRRARAQGCTCTWIWVGDAQGDGGTEPAVDLPFAATCPLSQHQN
jgi:hypothetical protein